MIGRKVDMPENMQSRLAETDELFIEIEPVQSARAQPSADGNGNVTRAE
jgi:hypothetical protein